MLRPFSIIADSLVSKPSITTTLTIATSIVCVPVVGSPIVEEQLLSTFKELMHQDICQAFLNPKEFGETVQYLHKSGTKYPVCVVFDDPYVEISGEKIGVSSTEPFCQIDSDIFKETPDNGDSLIIKNVRYYIDRIEPDGTGLSSIFLKRRPNVN